MSPTRVLRERPMWSLVLCIVLATVISSISAYLLATTVVNTTATVEQIEDSRRGITRALCEEQNDRHEKALTYLLALPQNPDSRFSEAERRQLTREFTQALVPKRNCDVVVARLSGPPA